MNLNEEYLLGQNEKSSMIEKIKDRNVEIERKETKMSNDRELIDIVIMEDEEKSQLSKITEVEYSHNQFSQEKTTNSYINSNFEPEKLNDQINNKNNYGTSPTHKRTLTNPGVKAPGVHVSSDSLYFTRSNNNSGFENSDFKKEDPEKHQEVQMNLLSKINFNQKKHKNKSRSLDLGFNSLEVVNEGPSFVNYSKNKTFDKNEALRLEEMEPPRDSNFKKSFEKNSEINLMYIFFNFKIKKNNV
jgi:hypothetical protein